MISIVTFYGFSDSKLVTYTLPILPPLAVLIARWFKYSWKNKVKLEAYIISTGFLCLEAGFLLLTYHPEWLIENPSKTYYLSCFILAGICCFNAIILVLFSRSSVRRYYFSLVTVTTAFLLSISVLLPKLYTTDNIYPIAQELNKKLQKTPNATVIMYKNYSQALPFYLQRTILIADWRNELDYGAHIDPVRGKNLISLQQLNHLAADKKRKKLWVIVGQDNKAELENQLKIKCEKNKSWYQLCAVN
ncbi:hypothetical protein [Piscirickettsia litoralis]|uniref:Aminoarabinose transferase C-terminal domain-containing protein n=1 Tax=Piscirickettsia litoralis TaxID=1891921 RepID=A0ABX3A0X6_9GAMM|nr:hypothetical protein [Piscirickettsia litoralis]ODN42279.1 hypothetical protein BGC07_04180 [Piscirickettsia litoralis]